MMPLLKQVKVLNALMIVSIGVRSPYLIYVECY